MSESDLLQDIVNRLSNIEQNTKNIVKNHENLIHSQSIIYYQIESLMWLQRQMNIKNPLPPLRGWAASPDVLLRLHSYILNHKPQVIVEFGSGVSTIVIADALRQNDSGILYSVEHNEFYGQQTKDFLRLEKLLNWVDLRVGELEPWSEQHYPCTPGNNEKTPYWYPQHLLKNIPEIDLVFVDGPPGGACAYSRYPALPAIQKLLSAKSQIWMDDTIRKDEKDICELWAKNFNLKVEYYNFEKGLGILTFLKNI